MWTPADDNFLIILRTGFYEHLFRPTSWQNVTEPNDKAWEKVAGDFAWTQRRLYHRGLTTKANLEARFTFLINQYNEIAEKKSFRVDGDPDVLQALHNYSKLIEKRDDRPIDAWGYYTH